MIGYAPFEPEEPPAPPVAVVRQQKRRPAKPSLADKLGTDASECNYLVMFFIAGVVLMAVGDLLRK